MSILLQAPALQLIAPFLPLKDLLPLTALSRAAAQQVSLILADYLALRGLPLALKQPHRSHQILKEHFNCRFYKYALDCLTAPASSLFVGGHLPKTGQAGPGLFAVLTSEGELHVYRQGKPRQVIAGVESYSANGRQLIYLSRANQLIQSDEEGVARVIFPQHSGSIDFFYGCFSYLVLQLRGGEGAKPGQRSLMVYNRKTESISWLQFGELIDQAAVLNTTLYLLSSGSVFESQFTQYNEVSKSVPSFRPVAALKSKNISAIAADFGSFLAVARVQKSALKAWSVEQVAQWASKNGLQDYSRILTVQRVDGGRLAQMSKAQMADLLGLQHSALQNKIETLVQDDKGDQEQPGELWVWGRNEAAQLGIEGCAQAKPQQAPLPSLRRGQRVTFIETQWGRSALLTSLGRVFVSAPVEKQKKEQQQQALSEQEDQAKPKGKRQKGKDKDKARRKGSDHKLRKEKESRPPQKKGLRQGWIQVQNLRGVSVSLLKRQICVLGGWQSSGRRRMRGAKQAVDKILWDSELKEHAGQFRVGYQDKYLGVLEVPLLQYVKSEIKEQRVLFIKRLGNVLWHKEQRLDLL